MRNPIFAFLTRNWFFLGLALLVVLGSRYPILGQSLKPWVTPIIFCGMLLIGIRIEVAELTQALTHWRALVICLVSGFVMMPLVSYAVANTVFAADRDMMLGVLLAGAIPTTQASSVIWTDMSGGNKSLALVLMTASNFFGLFLSPVILHLLAGASMHLPILKMIGTLLLFILLPICIGLFARRYIKFSPRVSQASRVVNILVIWVAVLTGLSTKSIWELPLLLVLIAVVLQYGSIAAFSYFGARGAGITERDSLAVMYCSAQVTITFAALIGFSFFEPRSLMYVVAYHIFQQFMGQVTARFLEKSRPLSPS